MREETRDNRQTRQRNDAAISMARIAHELERAPPGGAASESRLILDREAEDPERWDGMS